MAVKATNQVDIVDLTDGYSVMMSSESAALVVEVQGPVAKPALAFGKTSCAFDETLAEDESLVCRDGRTWKTVETRSGKTRRTGELSVPLPTLSGPSPLAFSGEVPADRTCVVEILKEYR